MTKVDIFSGFLGAGKTTLIKKLIQEAYQDEKLVLIENEFGEIGIDGGFMQEAGIEVTEMNSGCICCSLVGDFGKALQEVLDTYKPDRILIEPSGVGKLSDVMEAVRKLESPEIFVNACVTVADAGKCKLYMKNFGEFYNNQIEYAGSIVLSRTEQLEEKKLADTVALLRERNAVAPIITTPWTELSGVQILEAMEGNVTLARELEALVQHVHEHKEHNCSCGHDHVHEHEEHDCSCGHDHVHEHEEHNCSCGHDHHHHAADEVFQSWGMETTKRFNREKLFAVLEALGDEHTCGLVLRAKGMVPSMDGTWLHFDYVPGEVSLREGFAAITGRLCVIGAELQEETIAQLFDKA